MRCARDARGLAALCACAGLAAGCAGPAALPTGAPLATELRFAPIVPDEADLAAADVAAAALVDDPAAAAEAQARHGPVVAQREQEGEDATGLAPVAQDLANAAQRPGRAYLSASDSLLERDDVEPALRERIERDAAADPLARADARIHEARVGAFARAFNALVEPLGRSLATTALAPIRLGRSLLAYAIDLYKQDPLPLQRRQALVEWKDFLARFPEDPHSEKVARRALEAEARWQRMQKERALEAAGDALHDGRPGEAAALAERALRVAPDDRGAQKLLLRAQNRLALQRMAAERSTGFELPPGVPLVPPGTRELSLALLTPGGDVAAAAAAVPPDSPIADEARFAVAVAQASAGFERESERELVRLAQGDGPMARHAQVALDDPVRWPWRHFQAARRRDRLHATRFVLTGPARLPDPTPIGVTEWLLGLPSMVSTIATLPIRAIELPWLPPPPTARATALQARRYLALHPQGIHAETVRGWLEDYENARGNHVAALRVAEKQQPPPRNLERMREQAAEQTLEVARKEERIDLRAALLDGLVQRFPDTEAGGEAKQLLLEELEQATPQRIAIRRGFLLENPEVAGVRGLGLDPVLLDEDPSNGELHSDGVALVGGHEIELAFVAESGDEDDPPERRSVRVGDEQLARLVARLEETSFRNALLDADDPVVPDAKRDLVFERARLGLAGRMDARPEARSDFAYRGMRERYGVVRGREPWLPFDLVVQGSLADLSLGAFPRWREPKKSPDAALYE